MYNYLMLVGTIAKDFELKELDEGKRVVQLELAITRSFKNQDGEYDCDFVRITLWDFLADIAKENLKKGNTVGVKGRVFPHMEQLASGAYVPLNELVGERIIFFDKATKAERQVGKEDEVFAEDLD